MQNSNKRLPNDLLNCKYCKEEKMRSRNLSYSLADSQVNRKSM